MILLFLGSWRSTVIIAVSIPLSILSSIIVLSALGETINIMTLGGLALAVGILVDDATVAIENIHWHLEQGKPLEPAILDGAEQIAVPAFVSTLCICIVFVPMFFLTGVARYLFVPMAEAVVFAMLASYVLSRTLVPTMAKYLLKAHAPHAARRAAVAQSVRRGSSGRSTAASCRLRDGYRAHARAAASTGAALFAPVFLAGLRAVVRAAAVGRRRTSFPTVDSGQFKLHLRAPTGTRIEETAGLVRRASSDVDPRGHSRASEIVGIIDNIGLPYSGLNLSYSNSAPIGARRRRHPGGARRRTTGRPPTTSTSCGCGSRREFPGVQFSFIPADIVSQILNFGLPAPIDVQIVGRNQDANRQFAATLADRSSTQVPGIVDLRVHQVANQPTLQVDVDRTRAAQAGYTQRDVANNLLVTLSGSGQTAPTLLAQPGDRRQLPGGDADAAVPDGLAAGSAAAFRSAAARSGTAPQLLENLASMHARAPGMAVVTHYNVQPVIDIFGSVQGRDLGGVARDIGADHRGGAEGPAARLAAGRARPGRDDAQLVPRPAGRPRARDRARLPADRRELPVVARSVHHHLGAAGGARRHRVDAVRDAHHAQRAGADRRDHVHGRGDREQRSSW